MHYACIVAAPQIPTASPAAHGESLLHLHSVDSRANPMTRSSSASLNYQSVRTKCQGPTWKVRGTAWNATRQNKKQLNVAGPSSSQDTKHLPLDFANRIAILFKASSVNHNLQGLQPKPPSCRHPNASQHCHQRAALLPSMTAATTVRIELQAIRENTMLALA